LAAIVAGVGYAYLMAVSGGGASSDDAEQLALGREVYTDACASCHGANPEGQPNWKVRQANGQKFAFDESGACGEGLVSSLRHGHGFVSLFGGGA
jgi:cytochrome c5